MTFNRYQYQEAKAFLSDAALVRAYEDPCVGNRTWRKPDGSVWFEYESKLEFPEDDYRLEPVAPTPSAPPAGG